MANDTAVETEELEPEDHDWFLGVLVKSANNGSHIGITLQIGGFLVSGTLIGGAEYFEGFAKDFATMIPEEFAESFRQGIAQGAEPYKAARAVDLELAVEFVHIKDGRFTAHNYV